MPSPEQIQAAMPAMRARAHCAYHEHNEKCGCATVGCLAAFIADQLAEMLVAGAPFDGRCEACRSVGVAEFPAEVHRACALDAPTMRHWLWDLWPTQPEPDEWKWRVATADAAELRALIAEHYRPGGVEQFIEDHVAIFERVDADAAGYVVREGHEPFTELPREEARRDDA